MREDEAVTEAPTDDPVAAAPPESRSAAALARYRERNRRARLVYFGVVGVVVAALVATVAVAWSRGEAAHASLHTITAAPSPLAVQSPAPRPRPVWHTGDRAALGVPQWSGTVITYSRHTVGGRDARTGKPTWTYTRSDREVCTAAQAGGTTIAVYEVHGNCDELGAFDSQTGQRRWTRTLDKDGKPIDGRPAYQVLSFTFLVSSGTSIYAIDPGTGQDRWTYYRSGCHIGRVVLGSAGALISQTCSAGVKCSGLKFCATGPQLFLRDGVQGNGKDDDPNRDQIKWLRRGDAGTPVSADQVITTLTGDRSLQVLAASTGAPGQVLRLRVPAGSAAGSVASGTSSDEIIWLAGTTYAVGNDSPRPRWAVATPAAPTVVSTGASDEVPVLEAARITVPLGGAVALLNGSTGRVVRRLPATAAAGSRVWPLGAGLLVTSPAGTSAYR
jgi:outer membrane protein assembly factor BamB